MWSNYNPLKLRLCKELPVHSGVGDLSGDGGERESGVKYLKSIAHDPPSRLLSTPRRAAQWGSDADLARGTVCILSNKPFESPPARDFVAQTSGACFRSCVELFSILKRVRFSSFVWKVKISKRDSA